MGFEVFDQDIKMGLRPVYLFHGQEQYLIEQYLQKMVEKYIPESSRDFNYMVYDGEKVTVDELIDTCETVPFFSDLKIVVVKNAPYFKSKKNMLTDATENRLLEYFASPSDATKLIFISNTAIDKRKKITKSIDDVGRVIEFDKLSPNIYQRWVHKKIKLAGCDIEHQVLNYLIDRTSYLDKNSSKGLLDVDNDIKMVCSSLQGRTFVEIADIDAFIKKPLEANIFMMVEAIGEKKAATGILLMHELIQHGEAVQMIFTMISRQFRLLKKVKMLVADGYDQNSIAKILGQHPYAIKKIMQQIHLFSSEALTDILEKCSNIDYQMKSTSIDTVLAIETLLVELSFVSK
ncbi:MAG: DNA polymerase III subunit delta [Clostridia bacterium]|nr:DNA polymerase III subunit delta [Clostridia bacterium]